MCLAVMSLLHDVVFRLSPCGNCILEGAVTTQPGRRELNILFSMCSVPLLLPPCGEIPWDIEPCLALELSPQ